jgi:hypothetical protein
MEAEDRQGNPDPAVVERGDGCHDLRVELFWLKRRAIGAAQKLRDVEQIDQRHRKRRGICQPQPSHQYGEGPADRSQQDIFRPGDHDIQHDDDQEGRNADTKEPLGGGDLSTVAVASAGTTRL